MRRPAGWLLAGVPMELVLACTPKVAVCLSRLAACPDGFDAELAVYAGEDLDGEGPGPWRPGRRGGRRSQDPAQAMRFGVRYADGSKAELDAPWNAPEETPAGPVIRQGSGHGGEGEWCQDLWFWPLPPAGPITFALEWKAQGIELQLHELDAEPIRSAAQRSQLVFEAEAMPETPRYSTSPMHFFPHEGGGAKAP